MGAAWRWCGLAEMGRKTSGLSCRHQCACRRPDGALLGLPQAISRTQEAPSPSDPGEAFDSRICSILSRRKARKWTSTKHLAIAGNGVSGRGFGGPVSVSRCTISMHMIHTMPMEEQPANPRSDFWLDRLVSETGTACWPLAHNAQFSPAEEIEVREVRLCHQGNNCEGDQWLSKRWPFS